MRKQMQTYVIPSGASGFKLLDFDLCHILYVPRAVLKRIKYYSIIMGMWASLSASYTALTSDMACRFHTVGVRRAHPSAFVSQSGNTTF